MACMSESLSLDKTAERCGITHATAFVWRHKVLDAIGEALKGTELTGIAEADAAFLPISCKGDGCGRKPRKLGGLALKAMALIEHAASALSTETSANVPKRPLIPNLGKKNSLELNYNLVIYGEVLI